MMRPFIRVVLVVCFAGTGLAGGSSGDIDRDVWDVIRRTVVEADIEGMAATYHPDAVFVSPSGTIRITEQLDKWGRDMVEMEKAGTTAEVDFRFTRRQDGKDTAFETGMFRYTSTTKSGEATSYHVPFEALLAKKGGTWLMLMERQHPQADEAAWNALEPPESLVKSDDEYHILLTNDDGIEAPGIQVLAEHLRAVGRVRVVAPCGQRSGASMSVDLRDDLELRAVHRGESLLGHCVDTTPAGTVLLALTTLAPEGGFDLVVSGINSGPNVGAASLMSGTVGAAMTAAYYGVPSIAASRGGGGDYSYPARFIREFVRELKHRPPMPGVVYSINVPRATQAETKGVSVAKMGEIFIRIAFDEVDGPPEHRLFRPNLTRETELTEGSDTAEFMRGMITVTPLRFDWTAYEAIDALKAWELTHQVNRGEETTSN